MSISLGAGLLEHLGKMQLNPNERTIQCTSPLQRRPGETHRSDTLYGATLLAGILGVGNYWLVVQLRKWVMRWQNA